MHFPFNIHIRLEAQCSRVSYFAIYFFHFQHSNSMNESVNENSLHNNEYRKWERSREIMCDFRYISVDSMPTLIIITVQFNGNMCEAEIKLKAERNENRKKRT